MDMQRTMVGAVLTGPEQIEIRDMPVARPGPGEMLVSVQAATTCGTDVKVFRRGGHPRMLKVPTLFGHEMAGRVAALGDGVVDFKDGDAVVVANSAPCLTCEPCRRGRENLCEDLQYLNGAFAEFILVPERFVQRNTHKIPTGLDFGKAALTEPLACVLHGMNACALARAATNNRPIPTPVALRPARHWAHRRLLKLPEVAAKPTWFGKRHPMALGRGLPSMRRACRKSGLMPWLWFARVD